ncbi:MAG TPA: hypothetical protein VNA16_01475, partial [Abditibacteriaceae bacterium]|nr:hypothetical protein [Abditibacteriaceae bacterium]
MTNSTHSLGSSLWAAGTLVGCFCVLMLAWYAEGLLVVQPEPKSPQTPITTPLSAENAAATSEDDASLRTRPTPPIVVAAVRESPQQLIKPENKATPPRPPQTASHALEGAPQSVPTMLPPAPAPSAPPPAPA